MTLESKISLETVPQISIIILNWNGWEDTLECLNSIYDTGNINFNVIVLDNKSSDESISKIRHWADENIRCEGMIKDKVQYIETFELDKHILLKNFEMDQEKPKLVFIKNSRNYGFATGNNIGANFAINTLGSQYLMLLNNDMIVHNGFISPLMTTIQESDTIAACSSKILFYHDPKIINYAGASFTFIGRGNEIGFGKYDCERYDHKKVTGIPSGGAMLIKSEIVMKYGLFKDEYFAYHEDTDLAWRLWLLGHSVIYVPESIVYHKHRGSWSKRSEKRIFLGIKNRISNMLKYLQFKNVVLGILLQSILTLGELLYYIKYDRKIAVAILRGVFSCIKEFPITLVERINIQRGRVISDKDLIRLEICQTFHQTLREICRRGRPNSTQKISSISSRP